MIRNKHHILTSLVFMLILGVTFPALAQPDPTDPNLRAWFKADDLVSGGLQQGDHLTEWVDASSYGTIIAPRTTMNAAGPGLGQPVEEAPTLQMVDINGQSVPSVRFDRAGDVVANAGDPSVPGSGSADRLFQTNNLAPEFDPLNIGDGSDLTAFVVFNPDFTTTPALGYEPVIAKRGSSSSVWQLGINNTGGPKGGRLNYVTFDATTEYVSGSAIAEKTWHITALSIVDDPASPADTIDFWHDESMDAAQRMISLGSVPTNTTTNRNATTAEPFSVGAHSQACCGEGESFAGNIAEIIVYSKALDAAELESVEGYLNNKYFVPEPGSFTLLLMAAIGILGLRRKM